MKAYIITKDPASERCRHTVRLLESFGLETGTVDVPWDDPELLELLPAVPKPRGAEHGKSLLSCTLAHKRSIDRIATDDALFPDDWNLVFEDDIALHPSIEPSTVLPLVRECLSNAGGYDFAYLGVCSPHETTDRFAPPGYTHVEIGIGAGMCMHAYAVRKRRASRLYEEIRRHCNQPVPAPLDPYAREFFLGRGGVPLAGINFRSPLDEHPDHFGLFYQDRGTHWSLISRHEGQLHGTDVPPPDPRRLPVVARAGFELQRTGGKWLLTNHDALHFSLSDSAALIWQFCEQGLSAARMEETLQARFPGTAGLADDIRSTLDELERLGVISTIRTRG